MRSFYCILLYGSKGRSFEEFFKLTRNVGVKKISLANYAHFTSLSRALGTRRK